MKSFDCDNQLCTYEMPDANDVMHITTTTAEVWANSLTSRMQAMILEWIGLQDANERLANIKAGGDASPVPTGKYPSGIGTVVSSASPTIAKYLNDVCLADSAQAEAQRQVDNHQRQYDILAKQVAIMGNLRPVNSHIVQPTYRTIVQSVAWDVYITDEGGITLTMIPTP